MSGTVYRLQPRTPGHWGPPEEDEPVSLAMTHASSPEYWVGALGMLIGQHITGLRDDDDLRREYEEFLTSPIVADDPELAAILPPSRRKPTERKITP